MVDIITSAFVIIRKASITFYVYDRVNYCTCTEHLLVPAMLEYITFINLHLSVCYVLLFSIRSI